MPSRVTQSSSDYIDTLHARLNRAISTLETVLATYVIAPQGAGVGSVARFADRRILEPSTLVVTPSGELRIGDKSLEPDLAPYAKKDDLARYAPATAVSDISECATKDELKQYAQKSDLSEYATKASTNQYAHKSELSEYATKAELNSIANQGGNMDSYAQLSGATFTGPLTLAQLIPASAAGINVLGKMFVGAGRPVCSGGYSMTVDPPALRNSKDETSIIGSGLGSLALAPNTIAVGGCSRSFMSGFMSATGSPTITFRTYVGPTSSVLLNSFTITPGAVSNMPWRLETMMTCRLAGPMGTLRINSFFVLHDTSNASTYVSNPLVTFDTTATNIFKITAQWSMASPNNIVNVDTFNTMNVFFS
jgi:hypothetical protein